MRQLADMDVSEEEVETRLQEAQKRMERYRGYRTNMEEKKMPQMSLTDPAVKLMKRKDGFVVVYNVQTAVD